MTRNEKDMVVARLYSHINAMKEEIAKLAADYEELSTINFRFAPDDVSMDIHEYSNPNNQGIEMALTHIDFYEKEYKIRKPLYFNALNEVVDVADDIDDGYQE